MYLFSLLFGFLVLPYQACLACSPIKKMYRFCEDLKTGDEYVYQYETPAGSEIEVYSNNTSIAYRGLNKPFEANVSDKVIGVNNSAIILSECLNLTFKFFHVPQGMFEECHLHYIVAERGHEAVTTPPINPTDNPTDTSADTSGNGDKAKATSNTKEITTGVSLALLLGIAGFLVYRCGYIPWRDKQPVQGLNFVFHLFITHHTRLALAQLVRLDRDYLNTNRENQRDNGDPDDPAAEDAESLRSVLVVGRDHGDGVEEERDPTHGQETHVESSLLNGHLVNSQGEGIVQPMGSEGTDTAFSQKRLAGFPLVNGNHKASVNPDDHPGIGQTDDAQPLGQPQSNGHVPYRRVNDETKELTPNGLSPGPPQMNGGGPLLSDRVGEQPCGSADEENCSGEQAGPGLVNNGVKPVENV
ncbi:uncharacterized protein LOC121568852 isoform X2 [Coregonus clupeaformis]|uniref:uncharacterized protein LOC121568852 isoform X2 n=1 Tax=Coregonus clupeaformis TaxID=59861 RepID=UPI001BE04591|nr:uncharacterized protein LOC121568852 isoform X2 [Coregonus clupeaformis]